MYNAFGENSCKYRPYVDTPYVLHAGDLSVTSEVTYLPLYMTPLL